MPPVVMKCDGLRRSASTDSQPFVLIHTVHCCGFKWHSELHSCDRDTKEFFSKITKMAIFFPLLFVSGGSVNIILSGDQMFHLCQIKHRNITFVKTKFVKLHNF